MKYTTVTGIPVEEVPAALQAIFTNKDAYKGVPGGADLTDINTGFMLERVTEVFGLKGFGWNLNWKPEDTEFIVGDNGKRALARIKYAEFAYALNDEEGTAHWFFVPTGGANENQVAYAEEGARTSALGAALKGLTFQLPVYKGEYDHHDAQREAAKPANKAAVPQKPTPKAAAPAPVAAAPAPVADVSYTQEQLEEALKAVVPSGVPLAGKTLAEAMNDKQFGIFVIKFLAKQDHNKSGAWFKPSNALEEALVTQAGIVLKAAQAATNN